MKQHHQDNDNAKHKVIYTDSIGSRPASNMPA